MKNQILNIELKARSFSNDILEQRLISLGGILKGIDQQIDTYFNVSRGRLKIREGNIENSLIFYERVDDKKARESRILYEDTSANKYLKNVLKGALGEKIVVHKERKIYYLNNVKIHFDTLKNLGQYVEIEAIDNDGCIGKDQLEKQCQSLQDQFEIKKKDIIKFSYSDLIDEDFICRISREATEFIKEVSVELEKITYEISLLKADHLCYRVTNEEEYTFYKINFSTIGELLVESKIGGRLISTFKLFEPIEFDTFSVGVIELAAPKNNNKYALGFEHVEIVVDESFQQIVEKYPGLEFDFSGADKMINPELRLCFDSGVSLKFHHMTLEEVINIEKSNI